MELRQLEYFVAVAEEANFTRAAERVHISQSGVSAQIRALETELGADLFERTARRARLTGAGEAALPYAREALAAAGHLRGAVDDVNGLVRGRLVAGMVQGCEVKQWFGAIAGFHGEHPGIELELREGNSDALIADVRSGVSDVALVGIAGEPPDDLSAEVIISEGLAAMVPRGHPLAASGSGEASTEDHAVNASRHGEAGSPDEVSTTNRHGKADAPDDAGGPSRHVEASGRGRAGDAEGRDGAGQDGAGQVTLAEVCAYPIVALPLGTGIRSAFDQACASAGVRAVVALEASAPGAVADLGARGLGVAVLSRSMAAGFPEMVARPIDGVEVPALLAVVWRPRPSPAATAFVRHCREAFAA
jgi:DNA-binding transcriptional LysR family regulator